MALDPDKGRLYTKTFSYDWLSWLYLQTSEFRISDIGSWGHSKEMEDLCTILNAQRHIKREIELGVYCFMKNTVS